MSKIERKFHGTVPHNKLRLHSAERNTSWGKVFKEYKKSTLTQKAKDMIDQGYSINETSNKLKFSSVHYFKQYIDYK